MDDTPKPPLLFANKVISQMVAHLFGGELVIWPDDFIAMRVAFRRLGGLWDQVADGNIVHLQLLSKVVTGWGKLPGRETQEEQVV